MIGCQTTYRHQGIQSSIFKQTLSDGGILETSLQGKTSQGLQWRLNNVSSSDPTMYEFMTKCVLKNSTSDADVTNITHENLHKTISQLGDSYFPMEKPHGLYRLTLMQNEQEYLSVGHAENSLFDTLTGETHLGYSINDQFRCKGLATSMVDAIVTRWAPEVKRIGEGIGLNPEKDNKLIKQFRCFGDRSLTRIVTSCLPDNKASIRVLEKTGFISGDLTFYEEDNPDFDFTTHDMDLENCKVQEIIHNEKLLDVVKFLKSNPDHSYRYIDKHGVPRTINYNSKLDAIHYKFKYDI
ncbi:GNAT family N-acetyltransferase [Cardinium endosymbiont of Culicoides punctatus]|uniref:GNAT family N-acetyltransferase n=1 Tax=Cardinium endosymbiont of Culicoides punctatus TaxID=2304601 RepID=UPI0010E89A55|nr:GNAT family N-acetyltransferase [Cardinium endosymbiont of Culicoides punctatus]TDG95776.1 hypothetical protein CCPUN_00610 [Cardinium endosymbiont of Culicoides punctatus]